MARTESLLHRKLEESLRSDRPTPADIKAAQEARQFALSHAKEESYVIPADANTLYEFGRPVLAPEIPPTNVLIEHPKDQESLRVKRKRYEKFKRRK